VAGASLQADIKVRRKILAGIRSY